MSEEAFIYEAIRTPRGKQRNGSLNEVKPVNLVVGLIDELRSPLPRPRREPDQRRHPRRRLARRRPGRRHRPHRRAGGQAARDHRRLPAQPLLRLRPRGRQHRRAEGALRLGRPGLAGGVESMSRVPMGSDGGAWATDPETNYRIGFVPQGIGADLIATIEGFSREDVDAYARAVAGEGRRGVVGRLLRQVRRARSRTRTVWSSSTTTSTCVPAPPSRASAS